MIKLILIALISLNLYSSGNQAHFDHSHKKWNIILGQNVHQSEVSTLFDYKKMKKNMNQLNSYLSDLESVSSNDFKKFSSDQKLSFWINAYNAYTVKLVVNHYPVSSIRKIKTEKPSSGLASFFKKLNPISSPWKIPFIKILDKKLTLDDIEHNIIRKEFHEPRIHFAVNCASMGCPSLLNTAFNHSNLNQMLEKASQSFINNVHKNSFDLNNKIFKASKIFKWYGSDFNKKFGSFIGFVKKYKSIEGLDSFKVDWNDYDWNLNDLSHSP